MQDQFTNARMLAQAGAGIVLSDDFSNLFESLEVCWFRFAFLRSQLSKFS